MTSTLRRVGRLKANIRCYWTQEVGVSECSGRPIFFFIKENWIYAMTRHHAEPKHEYIMARNLPFNSDVRQ